MLFQKMKTISVLQFFVFGGSCFIPIDSGKGLYDMWTVSSMHNIKLIWKVLFYKINFGKGLSSL